MQTAEGSSILPEGVVVVAVAAVELNSTTNHQVLQVHNFVTLA